MKNSVRIPFHLLVFLLFSPILHLWGMEAAADHEYLRGTPLLSEWMLVAPGDRINRNFTDEQIEEQITYGTVNFIIPGIHNTIPDSFIRFKNKYGVGLYIENCAIDPFAFNSARENNKRIAQYLNRLYGEGWQEELPVKPLGIQ